MLITTTETIPGKNILESLGIARGSTVRARNVGKDIFASFKNLIGGEILVPKIPSYKILDLAKAICPNCSIKITGLREGEKINEELINNNESASTFSLNRYFVVLPNDKKNQNKILRNFKNYKKVNSKFNFVSDRNKFLSANEIKNILKKNKFL